ncbi:DNA-binding MarR family transcriptional regulator [Tumebacillus sp. BK434]|uniref:MarR family winged helix-turn-helix transcriptional regulator n=1 Tax=Tumebacillus sp. BK434 TaxID=2512169 RepID=UPI0010508005|nr:MarR family winged helix-turn-helix transcriptional regulator [Tumebacillus sp. BK434]TCP57903.1 DNA-binding MarR family transcriptional regulator [Tumebacillus sp. BK434]
MDQNTQALQLMEMFSRFSRSDWRRTTKWGLKASEIRVLLAVKERQDRGYDRGTTVSELSKRLKITSPSVTQMINSLIKEGYIERTAHPTDRRVSEITLTEQGREMANTAHDAYRVLFNGLIDHLGREQSEQLIDLLHQTFAYFQEVGTKSQQEHPDSTP